ncbi:hypothetical protein BVIR_2105 [Blastochloris viridis]|uniref:Uncharacterized protein n=1 Tax=Blastochloris viridis TaxID=1079 RepID=A0A0P0JCW0_BLAVI|nr:hypothetical protein BVIR_2105 [Blastochloris viridis]CUU42537.1 hypothetical protein BVIRIDIS_15500 [Blastochloris viridis]
MTGWVRDQLRTLARAGRLGRRASAAPVVVPHLGKRAGTAGPAAAGAPPPAPAEAAAPARARPDHSAAAAPGSTVDTIEASSASNAARPIRS